MATHFYLLFIAKYMDVKILLITLVFVVFAVAGLMIKILIRPGSEFPRSSCASYEKESARFAILKTPFIVPLKFILIKPVRRVDISNANQKMAHLLFDIMTPKSSVGFGSCLVRVSFVSGSVPVLSTIFT